MSVEIAEGQSALEILFVLGETGGLIMIVGGEGIPHLVLTPSMSRKS